MKRTVGMLGGVVLLALGCGAAPVEQESVGAEEATISISWTAVSPTGASEIKSTMITPRQAQWLKDARSRARGISNAPPQALPAAGANGVGHVQQALTIGSTDWADCQSYEWFLVTSGNDFSGNIFCAKFANGVDNVIGMPFVPHYFDSATASSAFFNLCTGTSECHLTQCCENGSCADVWQTFFQSSGTGNISPPNNLLFINSNIGTIPC